MGVLKTIFGGVKYVTNYARYKELGTFTATFRPFGNDMYRSYLVRACIRPLAEHSSKANAKCKNKDIERMLNDSPNMYMNGKDFLYKVRTILELKNTSFVFIERDPATASVIGLYPVPYSWFEGIESNNILFVKFHFDGNEDREIILPWDDLVVLRKDYFMGDIAGEDNSPVLSLLDLVNTTEQGIANAVKATANLRGILKSTKAMLSPDDVKKQKDQFVSDYLSLENEGGIASLDATQEFTPITMNPTVASFEQTKEFRENVYRYFGISDAIVMSDYSEQQLEAFYEARIEPFLVALSVELTRKCFNQYARGKGNTIKYESNRMAFASNSTKLAMVALVDRGALTPNEWREMFNLAPVEGGDEPIRRLDTATVESVPADEEEEK